MPDSRHLNVLYVTLYARCPELVDTVTTLYHQHAKEQFAYDSPERHQGIPLSSGMLMQLTHLVNGLYGDAVHRIALRIVVNFDALTCDLPKEERLTLEGLLVVVLALMLASTILQLPLEDNLRGLVMRMQPNDSATQLTACPLDIAMLLQHVQRGQNALLDDHHAIA